MTFLVPMAGLERVTVSYLGSATDTAVNGSISSSFSLGTAHPSRRILVAAFASMGLTPAVVPTRVNIGCAGQTITSFLAEDGATYQGFMVGAFDVPTGTTGTISATWSAGGISSAAKYLMAYAIYNVGSSTPKQVTARNTTIGIPWGGAIVGFSAGAAARTWTGLTKDGDAGLLSGASKTSEPELSPFSVSVTGDLYGALTQWEPG